MLAKFDNLRRDRHEFVLRNEEGGLVVDLIEVDSVVGAEGYVICASCLEG